MELNDLKKTWNKISSGKELDEDQLRNMLEKKTKSLIERIDRNVKIGFGVILILIILFSLDDLWLSPQTMQKYYGDIPIPGWVVFIAIFSNILVITTFLYFVFKYYKVKRNCDVLCNLKETLIKIINTLVLYQRLFYLALVTIIVSMGSAFITGMYRGLDHNAEVRGMQLTDIEPGQLILVATVSILLIVLFGGGVFISLRWGFRRLYGNYINKLKTTLKELEEIDE